MLPKAHTLGSSARSDRDSGVPFEPEAAKPPTSCRSPSGRLQANPEQDFPRKLVSDTAAAKYQSGPAMKSRPKDPRIARLHSISLQPPRQVAQRGMQNFRTALGLLPVRSGRRNYHRCGFLFSGMVRHGTQDSTSASCSEMYSEPGQHPKQSQQMAHRSDQMEARTPRHDCSSCKSLWPSSWQAPAQPWTHPGRSGIPAGRSGEPHLDSRRRLKMGNNGQTDRQTHAQTNKQASKHTNSQTQTETQAHVKTARPANPNIVQTF